MSKAAPNPSSQPTNPSVGVPLQPKEFPIINLEDLRIRVRFITGLTFFCVFAGMATILGITYSSITHSIDSVKLDTARRAEALMKVQESVLRNQESLASVQGKIELLAKAAKIKF